MYIQKSRHFAKSNTICVTFLFTKIQTLYLTQFFMKVFKLAFIYIQKGWHVALRDVFIYKKPDTLRYVIFYVIFEIGGGGGGIVNYQNKFTFR